MSHGMTHDEARDALEALALDALDASERDAVLTHIAGCAACRADLVALQRTAAELSYAAAPVPMSDAQRLRVRARLLARAAADRVGEPGGGGAAAVRAPASPFGAADVVPIRAASVAASAASVRRSRAPMWTALAAGLIAVLSVAALVRERAERDGLRVALGSAAAERGARARTVDSLRALVTDRDRLLESMTGAQTAVMTLAATSPTSPSGVMFWDQQRDVWVLVAHHLPAPRAGRAYQLWLVTPTAKISAGTFAPGPNGHAVMRATYALPHDRLAAIAVTDEPAGGSRQPTSAPVLAVANAGR